MRTPNLLKLPDLKAYLEQYATQNRSHPHLWTVHTDLPAFKKLVYFSGYRKRDVIANLITPKGATIRARNDWGHLHQHPRKMRATEAVVHSIFMHRGGNQRVSKAYSRYNTGYVYRPGETVRPIAPFDRSDVACTSGIHFFLELRRATQFPK